MKKVGKIVLVVMLALVVMVAFAGCEKSIDKVNSAMEGKNYTITTGSASGFSTTIATSKDNVLHTVSYTKCKDKETAESTLKAFEVMAKIPGIKAGSKGLYVYYGTTEAVDQLEKVL